MKIIRGLAVILFLLLLVLIMSCVPNQEATKKLQQKVTELDNRVNKLTNNYEELNTSISNLQVDIADMKKQITQLSSTVDTEMAKITKAQEEKLNQVIVEYEKKQKEKVQAKSTESPAPAGTETITKKIKKEEQRPVIKGKYYRAKSGETIADIARKFGVSESKIRQENGIPKGKEPLPNQNIFVPAK